MTRKTILILFVSWILPSIFMAQNSDTPKAVTDKIIFKGATIFVKPGQVIENGSILIERGIIKEVGRSVAVPYDAQVINVDSMFIYPAFISGATHTGWQKIEESEEKVADPGNPPADRAGLTPQRTIRSSFKNDFNGMRKQGFGYAQVVPSGRFIPGQGSIMSTGKGSFNDLYISENNALYCTLRSARRVFPNTILGVMSYYRELFKNVNNYSAYASQYALNPNGLNRPAMSEELKALQPYAQDGKTILFKTPAVKDIYRAIKLKKELGINIILTEVQQGTPILKDLKSFNGKILLSLDLPKKEDEKEDKNELTDEEKVLKERKKLATAEYVGQAATMHANGIKYGFSSLDVKGGDIKKNLLRILETDLTADDLLAALTINTAEVLGVQKMMGSLERGKIGNLFITDTLYFTEKSKIRYTLIDGELKEEKIKKSGKDNLDDIEGEWDYKIDIPDMTRSGKLSIKKDGESYEIKLSEEDAPDDFMNAEEVVVDDKNIEFSIQVTEQGSSFKAGFDLEFQEDTFEGNVTVEGFGTFPISGSKVTPK